MAVGMVDATRREAADRFNPWGVVDESKAVYVPRAADRAYAERILAGHDCHVQGSRQSGKSSLVNHAVPTFTAKGTRVAWVDLAGVSPLPEMQATDWARKVAAELFRSAGRAELGRRLLATNPTLSVYESLQALCDDHDSGLLVVLDEFDSLERYPRFAREMLGQIRAAQIARGRDPGLARLMVTLCSVKRPPEVFADLGDHGGPKEVGGATIWLEDFALDEETIDAIAEGFSPAERNVRDLARHALEFSSGYPQACMWVCRSIVLHGLHYSPDLPEALRNLAERAKLDRPDWLTVTDNYVSEHPLSAADALATYISVLNREQVARDGQDPAHNLLVWSGLCRVGGRGTLAPRCPLLAAYFDRAWARSKLDRIQAVRSSRRGGSRSRLSSRRICILNTGGTIGMVEDADGNVNTPDDPAELPFDEVEGIAEFEAVSLFSRDSANVGPRDWTTIATAIKQREGRFDGFVVAHGTDTLAYSASAVAFALGPRLSFPVVFTGSQTTVDVGHGDARSNLLRSALVAVQDLPEVVVCFGEYVLRACRAQKKDDRRFDAFESPAYPPLGYVAEDVYLNADSLRKNLLPGPVDLKAEFAEGILQVPQTPGGFASFYLDAMARLDERGRPFCRGVVIQSLGAGNVPTTESGKANLVPVIERAAELNIPVVLTSQYPVHPRNLTRYSPAQAAIHAGAIPTGNMTVAAVVAKLSWVLADIDGQIKRGLLSEERRRVEVRSRMQRDEIGEASDIVVESS